MPEDKKVSTEEVAKVVKINWLPQDGLSTVYANHLIVSHTGNEFYLVFGELVPPAPGKVPEELDVIPVARVAVSPESMLRMMGALQKNVSGYQQRLKEEHQDDDDAD